MSSISERINAIMLHFNHNKNSFSKAIGLNNNSVIGRIINDPDRSPSFDILSKIMAAFPEVNPEWLIRNVGNMLKDSTKDTYIKKDVNVTNNNTLTNTSGPGNDDLKMKYEILKEKIALKNEEIERLKELISEYKEILKLRKG